MSPFGPFAAERRIEKLKAGNWQFGCAGMHHGTGTEDCPRNRHHHHDIYCASPTDDELEQAGIDPADYQEGTRA